MTQTMTQTMNKAMTHALDPLRGVFRTAAVVLLLTLAASPAISLAVEVPPPAAKALRDLNNHLNGLSGLKFRAQMIEETVFGADHKLQFEGTMDVAMKKPASFAAELRSDYRNLSYRLHDGVFTVLDRDVNVYAQAATPGSLAKAFGTIALDYGADMPMSDLLSGQAYELLVERASRVVYIGVGNVDNQRCHHIAGSLPEVDWQIWVRAEGDPWLCKYVVTDRNLPMAPQFSLKFYNWEATENLPDMDFKLVVPEGAEQIEFVKQNIGESQ